MANSQPSALYCPPTDNGCGAEATLANWEEIERALATVLGVRGAAALCAHCRDLVAPQHPWLVRAHMSDTAFADLRGIMSEQLDVEVEAADRELMLGLSVQAGRLIGSSLTEKLVETGRRRQAERTIFES